MALVFTGGLHKYICEGVSMAPTLTDCEVVLVDKNARIEIGDIVVAKHPHEKNTELVKRVEAITPHGDYFLVGDNRQDSNDSRHFGAVTKEYLRGKVVARAWF